jgi:hypothetical protein
MRVICAWCQKDGRSGLLRVREPLDDDSETHGICERHQREILETFPSPSFPATRWLFIVPYGDAARFDHLVQLLRDVPGATVIVDRRRGERRRAQDPAQLERRRLDRRIRRAETNSLGYALVRFAVKGSAGPAPATGATEPSIAPERASA